MADWRSIADCPANANWPAVLKISRTTVASAMAQLREEGYLESRQGSGSRVILPDAIHPVPTRGGANMALDLSYRRAQRRP
ncbi:Uncharacterised protein [Citrobacter koseri]|uniref:Uncharacterized protein n=1 Tax=Citrobacter koseri TaxID=545 RepID=A0A2X2UY78_CITKO|nr:Uncharacterised protein [Citrobacter koseri]